MTGLQIRKAIAKPALFISLLAVMASCQDEHGNVTDLGIFVYVFCALMVATTIFFLWHTHRARSKDGALIAAARQQLTDFTPSWQIETSNPSFYLAFDDTRKKVAYIGVTCNETYRQLSFGLIRGRTGTDVVVFNYRDIESVDVFVGDTKVVTKSSALNALGGALIGQAIGGKKGFVIGGAIGDQRTTKVKVSSIEVRVLLTCKHRRVVHIRCLELETNAGGMLYDLALKKAFGIADKLLSLTIKC